MVDLIEDVGGFSRLAPEWSELLRSSGADSPFLTVEWLRAWWRHLRGSSRLHLLTVRDGDRLTAIAPLRIARGPLGMLPRLEFLGTGHAGSDYLDVIVRRGCERDALEALAAAIRVQKRTLRLTHLPPAALAARLANGLADRGWTARQAQAGICPFVSLAGHSWESYLASLGASHRANVRRRLRALSHRFDARFDRVTAESERRDALAALIGFHERRFGASGSTAFLTPALRAFHDEATAGALERGWLRMYVLRLDGATAAVMYGFAYNGRFYFYQHGFDARFEPFSVGLVLMGLTIQAALDGGATEFDMLYGTEQYKRLWASDQRSLEQIQVFPPGVAGFLHQQTVEAERSARGVARRILSIGGARAA